ncbi:MAG: hypothetical protein KDD14_24245, partial [Saprospiraceae bacterium]|nr:hypothetical protein [Saprospiraceae bacterium]
AKDLDMIYLKYETHAQKISPPLWLLKDASARIKSIISTKKISHFQIEESLEEIIEYLGEYSKEAMLVVVKDYEEDLSKVRNIHGLGIISYNGETANKGDVINSNPVEAATAFIQQGEIEDAIQCLLKYTKEKPPFEENYTEFTHLSSRYSELKKQSLMGINIESNRNALVANLQGLISQFAQKIQKLKEDS